jgi:hypothetical protein
MKNSMKTGKIIFSMAVICFATCIAFTACKKKDTNTTSTVVMQPDETGQSGSDSRNVQSENDAAVSDVNTVVGSSRLAGRSGSATGVTGSICGLLVDSVSFGHDTMMFHYNGTTCLNRTRTGSIRLTLQNSIRWKNIGATIKIEYINYKIVRASDQTSIMLNGTQILTNVSGGTWVNLVLLNQTIVNTITGTNLQVTFEDNKTATYNINRRMTYTYPGSILTCKAEGIGNSGTLTNLENYGTTRDGEGFTSQVTTPIVWNATCGGAVIQGAVDVKVVTKSFDLKFMYGVDASGNIQTVGANACPYGWKLQWTLNGNTISKVIGYN